jgi:hypothetical protein
MENGLSYRDNDTSGPSPGLSRHLFLQLSFDFNPILGMDWQMTLANGNIRHLFRHKGRKKPITIAQIVWHKAC